MTNLNKEHEHQLNLIRNFEETADSMGWGEERQ
jgi:hypothetical protein